MRKLSIATLKHSYLTAWRLWGLSALVLLDRLLDNAVWQRRKDPLDTLWRRLVELALPLHRLDLFGREDAVYHVHDSTITMVRIMLTMGR